MKNCKIDMRRYSKSQRKSLSIKICKKVGCKNVKNPYIHEAKFLIVYADKQHVTQCDDDVHYFENHIYPITSPEQFLSDSASDLIKAGELVAPKFSDAIKEHVTKREDYVVQCKKLLSDNHAFKKFAQKVESDDNRPLSKREQAFYDKQLSEPWEPEEKTFPAAALLAYDNHKVKL